MTSAAKVHRRGIIAGAGGALPPSIVNTLTEYDWAHDATTPTTSVNIPLGFTASAGNSLLFIAPCDHGGGVSGASGGGATWAVSQSRSSVTTPNGNIPTVAIGWGSVLTSNITQITLALNATFGVRAGAITVYEIDTHGQVLSMTVANNTTTSINTTAPSPTAITPTAPNQIAVIATMVNGNGSTEDALAGDTITYTPTSPTGWVAQKTGPVTNNVNGSVCGESGVFINGVTGTAYKQSITLAVGARDTIVGSVLLG